MPHGLNYMQHVKNKENENGPIETINKREVARREQDRGMGETGEGD